MTLSAICCPADCTQSRKEISHLIQVTKLCANRKAKAFGDPPLGAFPELAPAVLVLHITVTAQSRPRICSGQQFLFPEMTCSVWHNGLGWRGPRGWPHPSPTPSKAYSGEILLLRGEVDGPKMQIPQPWDQRDLPASLADLSTVKLCGVFLGLGSDLLSFVLPVFLNAPLLSTDAKSGISAVHFPYFLICPIIWWCFRDEIRAASSGRLQAGQHRGQQHLWRRSCQGSARWAWTVAAPSWAQWDWWREELLHRLVMELKCFHWHKRAEVRLIIWTHWQMFNKHLALLQPEQERIQCYLGTACRTTQEKQQSSATSLDTWMHRKARLSPSTAPRGTRIQLSPVCRPENFACCRKRDFTSNASEQQERKVSTALH